MRYEREILSDERLAGALDAAKRGAYSHAYALIADDLYTTSVAAAHLVAAITGASPQRVNQGGYADVHVLPVGKDKILSADVDFITSTAYLTPTELNKKFYVLEKASTMNESSQNKLLKTLEEAPPSVIIILEADKPSALLPTVLSRCVRVDIAPIAPDVLAEALSKHYPGREVYSAAALSGGYAGRAETILSDENYEKDFALAFDTLRFMKTARDILPFSRRWMERKNTLPDVLDWLAVILSDCMSAAEGAETRIRLKSEIQDIKQLSREYGISSARIIPYVFEAKKNLSRNCNAQAQIDGLLFKILEVKTKCLKL